MTGLRKKSSPMARLDAVIASVPQNATAARVVARGVHYEPQNLTHWHSDIPLPIVPAHRLVNGVERIAAELVGRRFGRLVVIGLFDSPNRRSGPAAWVVRCVCGHYETRRRKTLLSGNSKGEDRCSACWNLISIQEKYRIFGPRPIAEMRAAPQRAPDHSRQSAKAPPPKAKSATLPFNGLPLSGLPK